MRQTVHCILIKMCIDSYILSFDGIQTLYKYKFGHINIRVLKYLVNSNLL